MDTRNTIRKDIKERIRNFADVKVNECLICIVKKDKEIALAKGLKEDYFILEPGFKANTKVEARELAKEGHCVILTANEIQGYYNRLDAIKQQDYNRLDAIKQQEELEELHLVEVNYSWESGIRLYTLSTRIPPEEWKKVAHLFSFWRATEYEEDDEEWCNNYVGFATTNPSGVEKILNIPEKRTIAYMKQNAKEEKVRAEKVKEKAIEKICKELNVIQKKYTPLYADWSSADYSQEVGKKVDETENFKIHEYLVNDKKRGYTLKNKNLAEKYKIPEAAWTKPLKIPKESNAERLTEKLIEAIQNG